MQIKLSFSHTYLGMFRVAAVLTERKHRAEAIVKLYKDEGVFLDLLLETEIDAQTHARIVHAISAAATAPSAASCCEDVDLSTEQLEILQLQPVLTQSA